jgi:hypothetical protein
MIHGKLNLSSTVGNKKWGLHWNLGILALVLAFQGMALCEPSKNPTHVPKPGDTLPRISFLHGLVPGDLTYFGTVPKNNFSLGDIKAKLILVDLINSNCPFCVQSLPTISEIYYGIEQDSALKEVVKMVAIGTGNTRTEVDYLKKSFGIPFPVLPDPDYQAHRLLGEPRVPFLIIAKKDRRAQWVVVDTKVGLMGIAEGRTATYLEGDVDVETLRGDIFSVGDFLGEVRAILATDSKTGQPQKLSK